MNLHSAKENSESYFLSPVDHLLSPCVRLGDIFPHATTIISAQTFIIADISRRFAPKYS